MSPMADESEILVRRAARGDGQAARSLLALHLPALRAYVRLHSGARVRRQENDSDLVQSVCLELLRNLEGFRYEGEAAFRRWLLTAALRKIVQKDRHYRAARRDPDRLVIGAGSSSPGSGPSPQAHRGGDPSPSQVATGKETLERIERALDALSEEQREVVLLSRIAGLSHAQIAQRLGRSESTVRSSLSRALARLARLLAR